jgi:hypothetical protein
MNRPVREKLLGVAAVVAGLTVALTASPAKASIPAAEGAGPPSRSRPTPGNYGCSTF